MTARYIINITKGNRPDMNEHALIAMAGNQQGEKYVYLVFSLTFPRRALAKLTQGWLKKSCPSLRLLPLHEKYWLWQ